MLPSFEHIDAADLKSGMALLREPDTEALAGGTDLLGELKRRIRQPGRLINLKTIPGLGKIAYTDELSLGSLVTLSAIEYDSRVLEFYPVLAQAVSAAATLPLRHMGTAGGNLCQHPRCWYFRNPLFQCWLKGGVKCFAVAGENKFHAIFGRGRCQAVHPSDLAPALMALDARIAMAGPTGSRDLSLEDFYTLPAPDHRQMTVLERGELVTGIRVPTPSRGSRSVYLKAMERQAWSFALVGVAAFMRFENGLVTDARIVLGGVAPIPWRAKEAEKVLLGQACSETAIQRASEAAVSDAKPLRDNGYKIHLAKELIRQACDRLIHPGNPESRSSEKIEFKSRS